MKKIIPIQINATSISILSTIACSIFGAGYYCGRVLQELKDNDDAMKLRIETIELKQEYENQIHLLQMENLILKQDKDEK